MNKVYLICGMSCMLALTACYSKPSDENAVDATDAELVSPEANRENMTDNSPPASAQAAYIVPTYSEPDTIGPDLAEAYSMGATNIGSSLPADVLSSYGTYPSDAFRRHPEIAGLVSVINPDFSMNQVGVETPLQFVSDSSHKLLLLPGCTPHECGDTNKVIAFDLNTHAVSMAAEETDENAKTGTVYKVYGKPDRFTLRALFNHLVGEDTD